MKSYQISEQTIVAILNYLKNKPLPLTETAPLVAAIEHEVKNQPKQEVIVGDN